MPFYGQFSGVRSFGRGATSRPLPPTISNVADVGSNRAFDNGAIRFDVTPNAAGPVPDSYNAWAVDPQNNEIASGSVTGPTITIGGLKSNTQYTLKVLAVRNSLASTFTNFATPTLITTVPQAPTIGTATDVGTSRSIDNAAATVTFTAGASGGKSQTFKVYTSDGTERGSGSSSPLTASGIDTSSNSSYAFNVRAVNDNGASQTSGNTSNITLTTVPGAPSLTVDSTSGTTVNFSFSAPANTGGKSITSTRIFILSGGGSELATTTISASSGTGSLSIPELTDNDAFLRGEATNANGTGAVGSASTIIQRSGTPTLSVSRPDMQNATVTITNYNASFTYSVSTASGTATRSGATITIAGTTAGAFNVTVTMNQGAFFINRSAVASVPASTTPGTISNIQVADFGGGIINITWNAIAGAASYRSVLTGSGGATYNTDTNGISYDGLNPGSTYSLALNAYSGANATGTILATGSSSFTLEAVSPPPPPPPPSDPPPSDPPPSDPPPSDPPPSDPPPSDPPPTDPQGTICTSNDAAFGICNNAGPCSNGFGSGSACSPIVDFTPGSG